VVGAAAAALLVAGPAQPRLQSLAGPLGILGNSTSMRPGDYAYLVRVNPTNFRPVVGQRLPLGPIAATWAYSPDRSILAVGVEEPLNGCDLQASLRFVDAATLAAVGDLPLGPGLLWATAWVAPDRLAAVLTDCGDAPRLVVVDPSSRRVISTSPLPDRVNRIRAAGSRLVVMSSPADTIGPAKLTIVDGAGTIRTLVVDRVDVGFDSEHVVWPGLALTPDGQRAFLVSPTGLVADVDLGSLRVTYHVVGHRGSLAGHPGIAIGSWRIAEVLPTGALAVAGSDDVTYIDSSGQRQLRHLAAGLAFVNTKNWTAYTGDRSVDRFIVAGDTLLAGRATGLLGNVLRGDPREGLFLGSGLSGYTLFGLKRFHLFHKEEVFVTVSSGRRSFVSIQEDRGKPGLLRVIDLRKRKVVGTRAFGTLPWILQGMSSSG
jgi:hypothetical protein